MAEEIRLEVKRNAGHVWLNRVLGGKVLGSLWMPAAEWDAFMNAPAIRRDRAAALCAPLMDASDDILRYIFLTRPDLADRLRSALSGAAKGGE